MIILKHLTVEHFRLLKEVNLHFPQRGSILIQGPNEAGKSALLECIYFALYGETLVPSLPAIPTTPLSPAADGQYLRSLDELVQYGARSATVELQLSVGATELTITRLIERGKGQSVTLRIRRLGLPEEVITQLDKANERIIQEMGQIDGLALRNTFIIEQKGLTRLEQIPGPAREDAARKVLGLEKMRRLTRHFRITEQDDRLLQECKERLRLAEMQKHIPELSKQLEHAEASLDAVRTIEHLAVVSQQRDEIEEQEQNIAEVQRRRSELKNRLVRVKQLRRADDTLAEIIASYDGIAEARRQIPELEKQLAELDRREHEELPALEKRVTDLAELTRSFGTLQRMSNDLLTAIDTIKDLEQELKQHNEVKDDLKSQEQQVAHARARHIEAQKSLQSLEEKRQASRPLLDARLQRLTSINEQLTTLKRLEGHYRTQVQGKELAAENRAELARVHNDLRDSEQELALVEAEAKQVQRQSENLDKRWRQLSIRRQVEEWVRLKGLSQGLAEAEQHKRLAYERQEMLNRAADDARAAANKHMIFGFSGGVVALLLVIIDIVLARSLWPIFIGVFVIAVAVAIFAAWSFQKYGKVRQEAADADRLKHEAVQHLSMIVTARETALRMGGNEDDLFSIEQEIQSLGGSIPRSHEEALRYLQQSMDQGESLGDLQRQLKERLEAANAARNQVNITMEAVATLRKERSSLEEQYKREDWVHVDERIAETRPSIERLVGEIAMLAQEEDFPEASIAARKQQSTALINATTSRQLANEPSQHTPTLESLVEAMLKTTEREMAALDGKLDLVTDLAAQVKIHQEALDVLLTRQRVIEDRERRYQTSNPALQIERARDQQAALRQALQSLQDSLRQRVRPMGVNFGQAAITTAENTARRQLEELQITLGNKMMLQEKHKAYSVQLKELQESLSSYYKQLAKSSNTLGSWIVPPNPFAESLKALRTRCHQEIQDADEPGIGKSLTELDAREGAAQAKISLCTQESEEAQAQIDTLLQERKRPPAREYTTSGIVSIWPLVGEYQLKDLPRLEEQRARLENELSDLEEQEMDLSKELHAGGMQLDFLVVRSQLDQQERAYQTKKLGGQMVKEVDDRLMRKVQPRTEYYMQQILPLLTSGRYHDIHLTTSEEGVPNTPSLPAESGSNGTDATTSTTSSTSISPFQISAWDAGASEYVPKSALSGGAADALSLALRLAFSVAVLPRELNAAPGFVLLDEPLSSFDRGRARALLDVLTGDVLGQHFEQIILVSHSSAFDPAMFPYHVYMDNGIVIESNLPIVNNSAKNGHEQATPQSLLSQDEQVSVAVE